MIIFWLSGRRGPQEARDDERAIAFDLTKAMLGGMITRRLAAELREHYAIRRFVHACQWVIRVSACLAVALMLVEGYGPFEAVWEVWQTATTVGFGTHPASTVPGRLLILLFGTIDIGLVGYAISAAFEVKEYLVDLRRFGLMPNPEAGAYVIIHAPTERDLKLFVRGVRLTDPDAPVCVVDGDLDQLPSDLATLPHVYFIKGSALDPSVLENANIARSKAVVVYSLNKDQSESDAATLTVVKLLWRIPGKFRISYLLVEPANEHLFEGEFNDAVARGRSRPAPILRHMATLAAVTSCRSSRAAETVTGLVLAGEGAIVHTESYPAQTEITWSRFVAAVQDTAVELNVAVNPLSFALDGQDHTNTCPRPADRLGPGTFIVYNASPETDWPRFSRVLGDRLAEAAVPLQGRDRLTSAEADRSA